MDEYFERYHRIRQTEHISYLNHIQSASAYTQYSREVSTIFNIYVFLLLFEFESKRLFFLFTETGSLLKESYNTHT